MLLGDDGEATGVAERVCENLLRLSSFFLVPTSSEWRDLAVHACKRRDKQDVGSAGRRREQNTIRTVENRIYDKSNESTPRGV